MSKRPGRTRCDNAKYLPEKIITAGRHFIGLLKTGVTFVAVAWRPVDVTLCPRSSIEVEPTRALAGESYELYCCKRSSRSRTPSELRRRVSVKDDSVINAHVKDGEIFNDVIYEALDDAGSTRNPAKGIRGDSKRT